MSSDAATATIDHQHDPSTSTGIPNKKLFMWAFLASDCMFFGTLIATHLVYRMHPPADSPQPRDLFSLGLTGFSTFILMLSSLMMALAINAIQKNNLRSMRHMLLATIVLGVTFLGGQVYEFNELIFEHNLTLSSSMFGSTFFTLTGTHGCHVGLGILWLCLMYIRSFKPADGSPWLMRTLIHALTFAVVIVAGIKTVLGIVGAIHEGGASGMLSHLGAWDIGALVATVAGLLVLAAMGRTRAAVDFNESNAIDVESLGLYWHFVDIVWIVLFTFIYLLEFI
jgi:cytochrome o ubiquinol oxidase subunit 3